MFWLGALMAMRLRLSTSLCGQKLVHVCRFGGRNKGRGFCREMAVVENGCKCEVDEEIPLLLMHVPVPAALLDIGENPRDATERVDRYEVAICCI